MPEFPDINDAPDFHPPPDLASGWPAYVWLLIVLGACGLAWYFWKMFQRSHQAEQPPAPPLAPSQSAMELLEQLRSQSGQIPDQDILHRVVQVIRTWLHRSFGILANYRTPEEILSLRQQPNQPPPPPVLLEFQEFLLASNALNYGRGQNAGSVDEIIDQAIDLVRNSSIARTS